MLSLLCAWPRHIKTRTQRGHLPQVNIHCIEIFFTVQDFWATCACREKQSLPWNLSLYWIYFLPFRIFEQLCAWPEIFCCIKYTFYIQDFWRTCTCPEKQCAQNSLYWIYIFCYSGFLSNLHLPWKSEMPWNFSLYWNIFYHSVFWATCACPENRVCPETLQDGGLPPLRLERLCLRPWASEGFFPWMGATVVIFHFTHSKLRKQLFCWKFNRKISNFKIQGGKAPPCTPSDIHACGILCIAKIVHRGLLQKLSAII